MSNVTINIKNCGCCGGAKSPNSGVNDPPVIPPGEEIPDGYSVPSSGVQDRQCKMSIWLYDWLQETVDFLGNTSSGSALLFFIRTASNWKVIATLGPALFGVVATILSTVITTSLDPTDFIVGYISYALAASIVASYSGINTVFVSQPSFQEILSIIQANQERIICAMSTATNASEAKANLETALDDIDDMTSEYILLVMGWAPDALVLMLFWSADWWPSFDEDYLSTITETCCGDYVPGDPVVGQSTMTCEAATFIIDKLIVTFEAIAVVGGSFIDLNPFNDTQSTHRDYIVNNLTIPRKVKALIDWFGLIEHLSQHSYQNVSFLDVGIDRLREYANVHPLRLSFSDGLMERLIDRREEAICALFSASSKQAAYTALYDILNSEIEIVATNKTIQDYMREAIKALIDPSQSQLLNLLFTQDADLLGYPTDGCIGCGPVSDLVDCMTVTNGSILSVSGNEITFQSEDVAGTQLILVNPCQEFKLTVVSLNGFTNDPDPNDDFIVNDGDDLFAVYEDTTPFVGVCGRKFWIRGNPDQFTAVVRFEPCDTVSAYLAEFDFEDGTNQGLGGKRTGVNNPGGDNGYINNATYTMSVNDSSLLGNSYIIIEAADIIARSGLSGTTVTVNDITLDIYFDDVHWIDDFEVIFEFTDDSQELVQIANGDEQNEHLQADNVVNNPEPAKTLRHIILRNKLDYGVNGTGRIVSLVDNIRIDGAIT